MAGSWEGTENFVDGAPPSKTIHAELFLDDQGVNIFLKHFVHALR